MDLRARPLLSPLLFLVQIIHLKNCCTLGNKIHKDSIQKTIVPWGIKFLRTVFNYTTQFVTHFFFFYKNSSTAMHSRITAHFYILLLFRRSLPTHISSIRSVASHLNASIGLNTFWRLGGLERGTHRGEVLGL